MLNMLNRFVGFHWSGGIEKAQQQPAYQLLCNHKGGHTAKAPGEGKAQSAFRYTPGAKVKEKIFAQWELTYGVRNKF